MMGRLSLSVLIFAAWSVCGSVFASSPLQKIKPQQIDRNGDGLITKPELEQLRAEIWPQIDVNKDGQLAKPELEKHFGRTFDPAGSQYFAGMDKDRNQKLSAGEVNLERDLWWGRVDLDKNGAIDQLELLQGMANLQNGKFGVKLR